MTDYLLSVQLLVKRLHLDHNPDDEMPIWVRKDSTGSHNGDQTSGGTPSDIEVVYRRNKGASNTSSSFAHEDRASNSSAGVFRYPSVNLRECQRCKTIYRSRSRERTGSSNSCPDCLRRSSQADDKLLILPIEHVRPLLSVTSETGSDQMPDISFSPTFQPFSNDLSINNDKLLSPHFTTRRVSNTGFETSMHGQGLCSPLAITCSDTSRNSQHGNTYNTTGRRKSSVSGCKQRLSLSKSLPLSPQIVTKETRERQLCGVQLKLDTLKAELLAMRRADQDIACQLLQLHSEIQVQKVKRSCMKHSELLEEAMYEAEIADECPEVCDLPQRSMSRLLTSNGVTNFNISCRRFSCC